MCSVHSSVTVRLPLSRQLEKNALLLHIARVNIENKQVFCFQSQLDANEILANSLELRNSTKAKRKIPKQFLNARVVLNMVSIWLICVTILRKLSRIRMVDTSPVVCETRIKNISWLRVSIPTATSTKYFMVSKSCGRYTSRLFASYKCICIKIVILH